MGKKITDEEIAEMTAKYDNLKDFRKDYPSIERDIRKRGLVGKFCAHMKRESRPRMSEKELADIASRYGSMKEFRKKEWSVYVIIHRRGLTDKLCSHMKREVESVEDEEIFKIALQYNSVGELRKNQPRIYRAIHRRGLYEKLCSGMKSKQKTPISDAELAQVASKYSVLKDFMLKEPSVYAIIHKRGLMEKLCGHMSRLKRDATNEQIAEIASRYHCRKDFMKHDRPFYTAACRRGIIDKVCDHMERLGNFAKRKVYVFTFSDGYAYVGLTQDPRRRYRQHLNGEGSSPIMNHIRETGATFHFSLLTDWLYVDEAGKMEDKFIKQYAANGWRMLNKMSGGAIGSPKGGYTKKILQWEADKYEYVEDFKNGSPRFYNYIVRNHLFDEYCSKMKRRVNV